MTITAPVAVAHPQPHLEAASHEASVEVSRDELIRCILRLRTEAYLAGRRVPGRPALAEMIGVSPYRVRQALEEIARDQPRLPEHDQRSANEGYMSANGPGAGGVAARATQVVPDLPKATSKPREPGAPLASTGDIDLPGGRADERAPVGASTSPASRRTKSQRDIAGSLARTAVLISMFALAAAIWVKAADLSGHQIELAVLPVVNWPVRLAYFAPILVEGAVYAAIRICHTLDYVRDGTRDYARRTAAIGLVAMVLVGATVGFGFADEPYIRDGIGGLIGGLGPYMGWRTSRASAMVAGDRRAATTGGAITAETAPARSSRFAGLMDTIAMAANTRVSSWARTSGSGARTTPSVGANSSAHVAPEQQERHDSSIQRPAAGAGAQSGSVEPADAVGVVAATGATPSTSQGRDPRS